MDYLGLIFFLFAALYIIAYFVEIPIFYEGNPKTRFLINKLGKKGYKMLLLVFAAIFIVLAIVFK